MKITLQSELTSIDISTVGAWIEDWTERKYINVKEINAERGDSLNLRR